MTHHPLERHEPLGSLPLYHLKDDQGRYIELSAIQLFHIHLLIEQQLDQIQEDIAKKWRKRQSSSDSSALQS